MPPEIQVFEDFYPVSKEEAYFVGGPQFVKLIRLCKANWSETPEGVVHVSNVEIVKRGTYLRLGNFYNGELIYSEKGIGVVGSDITSKTAHQPFKTDHGLYYTDDSPNARIYKDGELFLDHWDGYKEIGNPFIDGDLMYFEGREDHKPAPKGWEIWTFNLRTGEKKKILQQAANPYVFEGKMYYTDFSQWRKRVLTRSYKV